MISATPAYLTANQRLAKKKVFRVDITNENEGVLRSFYMGTPEDFVEIGISRNTWIESIEDLQLTVSDLEGGAELADLVFTLQDASGALTEDYLALTYEGKLALLYSGFADLDEADYTRISTHKIDNIASANDNNSYTFTCPDIRKDLSKIIYTVGDDGRPTDEKHPRTLNGHPLDILLAILSTEVGYADAYIDTATIETYRDGIFAGVQFTSTITSPPEAKEFIEKQLMQPLGGYIYPTATGAISVHFFYPKPTADPTEADLDDDSLLAIPLAEQAPLVNQVSTRFDKSTTEDKFLAESVNEYGVSISKYGLFDGLVIESDGMRSEFQGFFLASLIAYLIFLRYGLKALQMEDVQCIWEKALWEPGDPIRITQKTVPDRDAGSVGIVAKPFEILDRTWHFQDATVSYRVLSVSEIKAYYVTPDDLGDFTASSAEEQGHYMYLCNDSDQYSDSTPGNTLS